MGQTVSEARRNSGLAHLKFHVLPPTLPFLASLLFPLPETQLPMAYLANLHPLSKCHLRSPFLYKASPGPYQTGFEDLPSVEPLSSYVIIIHLQNHTPTHTRTNTNTHTRAEV